MPTAPVVLDFLCLKQRIKRTSIAAAQIRAIPPMVPPIIAPVDAAVEACVEAGEDIRVVVNGTEDIKVEALPPGKRGDTDIEILKDEGYPGGYCVLVLRPLDPSYMGRSTGSICPEYVQNRLPLQTLEFAYASLRYLYLKAATYK